MVDVFEKIGEVSTMDDSEVKKKFGSNRSTVQKVLKGLLLEQLQEEQKRNSGTSNYSRYKKKVSSEVKEQPKNPDTSASSRTENSNTQKK